MTNLLKTEIDIFSSNHEDNLNDNIENLISLLTKQVSDAGRQSVREWTPPADIHESDSDYIFEIELPGMRTDQIEVTIERGKLVIQGERTNGISNNQSTRRNRNIERQYGLFVRSFTLPNRCDPNLTSATYRDGILSVVLPKYESEKLHRIPVTNFYSDNGRYESGDESQAEAGIDTITEESSSTSQIDSTNEVMDEDVEDDIVVVEEDEPSGSSSESNVTETADQQHGITVSENTDNVIAESEIEKDTQTFTNNNEIKETEMTDSTEEIQEIEDEVKDEELCEKEESDSKEDEIKNIVEEETEYADTDDDDDDDDDDDEDDDEEEIAESDELAKSGEDEEKATDFDQITPVASHDHMEQQSAG